MASFTARNRMYCVLTLKRSVGIDDSSSSSFTFFRISCQSASLFRDLMAWEKKKREAVNKVIFFFFFRIHQQSQKLDLFSPVHAGANIFLLKTLLFPLDVLWKGAEVKQHYHSYAAQASCSEKRDHMNTKDNFQGNTWPENKSLAV